MLYQLESARMVYQCISGNSGFRMIRFRESSVYDHHLAVCFYRILTLDGFYGYMPVDDMAVCSYHAELVQQHVTYFFFIAQAVIVTFHFLVQLFLF